MGEPGFKAHCRVDASVAVGSGNDCSVDAAGVRVSLSNVVAGKSGAGSQLNPSNGTGEAEAAFSLLEAPHEG